jgi:hypothetical protein
MPNRAITYLGATASVLFITYMMLVAATIYFASVRTEVGASVRALESEVAALETDYYDTISKISAADVAVYGYVTPNEVQYVARGGEPTLTRADQ